ncbi:MAG: glycosyltransferase family 1 protein [Candidatus Saccharibacteria bacterium]|nr:glycosyltransferase family 1 protein [Candidatus Saccharibacteria bacterium]
MKKLTPKPIKIAFDASAMLVNRTGVAYYTERVMVQLAKQYPDEVKLVGFYYNFLGRRNTAHMPVLPNLTYRPNRFVPSKVVYQLRRWGIEFPVELFTKQKADFILFPNFIDYPSIGRTPRATVVHDMTYYDLPDYVSAKLRSDLIRFTPRQIKRSKFTITVSEFTKSRIHDVYQVPLENILVTPIPPPAHVDYPQARQDEVLEEAGITKPYILFLGTIEPRKNVANIVEAYTHLPKSLRDKYQLVIAGRVGWYADEQVAKIKEAQDAGHAVLHIGYVTDEAKDILFQRASLFTWASHYEGFGMPLLEAVAYAPLACSDIPVFREVAGDAAIYFDHTNPDSIAKAFTLILEDEKLRDDLQKKAQKQLQKYDWAKVAQTIYDKITQTLEK